MRSEDVKAALKVILGDETGFSPWRIRAAIASACLNTSGILTPSAAVDGVGAEVANYPR
jgi:hypothetical protein